MNKTILTLSVVMAAVAVCHGQTIITMPIAQNPLFEVSTDKVELVMPNDGGGVVLGGNVVVTGGSGEYTYRWYNQKGAELGIDATLYAEASGKYMLDISDSCNCLKTIEFDLTSAGIDATEVNRLNIGPNPTTGTLYISGVDVQRIATIDMSGRLVSVIESNGNPIISADYTALTAGEYLLTIATTTGQTIVYKMIKK
jgi:hypothetical protein